MIPDGILPVVRARLGEEFKILKESHRGMVTSILLKKGGRKHIRYILYGGGYYESGRIDIKLYRRILKSRIPNRIIMANEGEFYEFDKNYLKRYAKHKENRVKNEDGTITLMFPLTEKQRWVA